MSKSIVLLTLVSLGLLLCVSQPTDPQVLADLMRPVKQLPSKMPSTEDIEFSSFEFQQVFITHHPGTSAVEGEPTKGIRYFVEAEFYGEEAIATAKFEAVDLSGNLIERILIGRQPGPDGDSEFYGVMKVPDRPFRVVVSGEGIDGRSYSRTYERLFRPTSRLKSAVLIPPGGAAIDAKKRQQFEAAGQEYIDKMERDLRKTAGEIIVIPRTRVSNVMYAAYLSKTGFQLGVRITFDVEFSHDGYFNPELQLVLDYKNGDWRGVIEMSPLTGSIEPKPEEPGTPQSQPHMLAYGAGYIYHGGTTYHFTADYVPDYVIQNENKTKFCIYHQKYKHSPPQQAIWGEILASKAPTPYRLFINNTDFIGEIEGLDAQGTLLKNFMALGAKDCGEQPTNRF